MNTKSTRVAIYARVSTSHHEQKPEIQTNELKRYCEARGWRNYEEFVDHGYSGGTDNRPGLKRLLAQARSREIDVIVVTKLDRLFRSLKHLVTVLDEFSALGVQFIATKDAIDWTTPTGRLFTQILASLAEFEKELIRERTLAGLAHARATGKRLGRPTLHDHDEIRRLRANGLSYRAIVRKLNAPMGVVTKAIKNAPKSPLSPHHNSSKKTDDETQ